MKKLMLSALFAAGVIVGVEAAPTDTVTQADLKALIERINKLEAENKAQAQKIAQLEGNAKAVVAKADAKDTKAAKADEGTEISESGKVYTTANGKKYFLADATANIFEPLSESGLQITPYGYLVFEGVYADHGLDMDWSTDFVHKKGSRQYGNHNSTLSMQDSILGVQFMTPEAQNGWKFSGKAEFDLAGEDADSYDFHWRHLYVDAAHESGWSFLFGQTWHLWKMVTPSEIDGAWLENAGHPYRRSPQIRVTKKWDWEDSSLEWRVGFLKNGPSASTDRDDDGMLDSSSSAWGWFETAMIYDHDAAWDKGRRWLAGVGGMYGRDCSHRPNGYSPDPDDQYSYNLTFSHQDDNYNSQMIMLAASVPFLEKFTLTGQIYGGENLGRVQGGCAQSIYYLRDHHKGKEVTTVGGFLDLAYELNSDWSFALGYGFDNPHLESGAYAAKKGSCTDDFYDYNDRLYIDAFYQITSNFKLGLEYARLSTDYAKTGDAIANRVQFSAYYDF